MCNAQEQDPSRGQRQRRDESVQSPSHSSPLDRLRGRSAEERWQRHRGNSRWSPSDPFQRDWATGAPAEDVGATEEPATTQFPWASSSDTPTTSTNEDIWHTVPNVDESPNATVAEPPSPLFVETPAEQPVPSEPAAEVTQSPRTEPLEVEPTPAVIEHVDPFGDSRWVDLEEGPRLEPSPTAQPFNIEPVPVLPYGPEPIADYGDNGLIAPGGTATLSMLDDPIGQAPSPLPDSSFLSRIKPIREITPYFQPEPLPEIQNLPDSSTNRNFVPAHYTWAASNVYHNPLYFEDAALERYGHTHHHLVQPFVSVGKFGAQFVGLPYQMAIDPVWDEQYTLGWYRPGEPAPRLFYQVPWNWKAAATAAGTYTGLIFLFP